MSHCVDRLELHDTHVRLRLARIPSALISLGMLSLSPAFAADTVSDVSPANASHTALLNSNASATLTGAETSGLTPQTFVIHPSQTTRTGANGTSGSGTSTITIDPFNDFYPGERVQVTLTDGVQTSQGGVAPYAWCFRTRVTGGHGTFAESSNSLGDQASRAVSLGDVDGDGDLDAFVANRRPHAGTACG